MRIDLFLFFFSSTIFRFGDVSKDNFYTRTEIFLAYLSIVRDEIYSRSTICDESICGDIFREEYIFYINIFLYKKVKGRTQNIDDYNYIHELFETRSLRIKFKTYY